MHSRTTPRCLLITTLLAALVPPTATAHEFWIQPATFSVSPGERLDVALRVGDGFDQGVAYPRNPAHMTSFSLIGEKTRSISGKPGADPAGRITIDEDGTLALAYTSSESTITLEAERFESYLRTEGLEEIIRLRERRGESQAPGREAFSRCAKSLVRSGEPRSTQDGPVGLELEIVTELDPYQLEPGDRLPVRVLWRGEPLAAAQIRTFVQGNPEPRVVRTGPDGRAPIELTDSGVWLLSVVHMESAQPRTDVDWLSTWSSLTFEIR